MNTVNIKKLLIIDCFKVPINTNTLQLIQICGVLVYRAYRSDYCLLGFDDGTAVINCKVFKHEMSDDICEKLDFGICCTVEGVLIQDYVSSQPMLNVYHIAIKSDRNFELEFKLHCIYLKKLNKEQIVI